MGIGHVVRRGAALSIFVLLLGLAGSALAATPTWLEGEIIESQAQNSVNGLSCPSATSCFAATDGWVVVQDNGLSYEQNPDSSILDAVSCARGTHFCMFVDNTGGAFTYNNGTFGSVVPVGSSIELDGVSCPAMGFCMAIDGQLNSVFEYSNGSWDNGTPLPIPGADAASNFVNVSCVSTQFCMALVGTDMGELYYTWDGMNWSTASTPFDTSGGHTVSLSCTSTSFCLETDETGYASVFDGSKWSTPQHVDSPQGIANPVLYSACAGTSCVAVDTYDNFVQTSDGQTWTTAVNIGAQTGMTARGIASLTCATATLCVAGDGEGDATTYAVPPSPGKPALTGTRTVGQKLTLIHATVQTQPVWYADQWFRCATPTSSCTLNPISTSPTGYTLTTADVGKYIDVHETIGFGFDEEGTDGSIVSNSVGPVVPKPGTAKLAGTVTATKTGVVTIPIHCTGGPCKGTVKLTYKGTKIGSAGYSIAAGVTAKIKITLNTTGKNQLKQHNWQLPVKLIITPATGTAITYSITLKA